MKKIILGTTVVALVGTFLFASPMSLAQTENPPQKVEKAFNQKFPNAKKVDWENEDGAWEAEFEWKGTEYSANFSENGDWLETEHEISENQLPAIVKNTLSIQFKGYDIEEVEISEKPDGTFYEIEMEQGETDYEVTISPSGQIVKKVKEEEEND